TTTTCYPLSLPDALPIFHTSVIGAHHPAEVHIYSLASGISKRIRNVFFASFQMCCFKKYIPEIIDPVFQIGVSGLWRKAVFKRRSEEHTSELQSRENLVC